MSDFLCNVLAFSMAYFFSLCGVEYAMSKSKKTKICIIAIITLIFSCYFSWVVAINQQLIPIDAVEQEWKRYASYCHDEHISWSELTFPEWLEINADYQKN